MELIVNKLYLSGECNINFPPCQLSKLVLSYTNLSSSLPEGHKQEHTLVDTDTTVTSPNSRKIVSSDSKTSNHPSVKVSAAITKLNHGSILICIFLH